jgi:hypothetical protein
VLPDTWRETGWSETVEVVSRYDIRLREIYSSALKHGIAVSDIEHAVDHALVAGDEDDGKVLYLGPDRAGNLLEVVSVLRDDGTEIVIHAMRMRRIYESYLREVGEPDE